MVSKDLTTLLYIFFVILQIYLYLFVEIIVKMSPRVKVEMSPKKYDKRPLQNYLKINWKNEEKRVKYDKYFTLLNQLNMTQFKDQQTFINYFQNELWTKRTET